MGQGWHCTKAHQPGTKLRHRDVYSPWVVGAQPNTIAARRDLLEVIGFQVAVVVQLQLVGFPCPLISDAERAGAAQRCGSLLGCRQVGTPAVASPDHILLSARYNIRRTPDATRLQLPSIHHQLVNMRLQLRAHLLYRASAHCHLRSAWCRPGAVIAPPAAAGRGQAPWVQPGGPPDCGLLTAPDGSDIWTTTISMHGCKHVPMGFCNRMRTGAGFGGTVSKGLRNVPNLISSSCGPPSYLI